MTAEHSETLAEPSTPPTGPPPAPARTRSLRGRYRRVLPRPRVLFGSLLLAVFVSVLVVQAYINAEFTGDHVESEVGDQSGVPVEIRGGGPVINTTGGQERTHRMPARTIALTFDDGPDPIWTPKILEVLRENDAHGTFFVVGSQVTRHPDLTKRISDSGHELGVHTFTHPNLQRIAPWRRKLEYSQTQMAIARAAGVKTALLRFPYSSKTNAIDETNWQLVKDAGKLGYLVVVNDADSQDWAKPGVAEIVRNATPAGHAPAVVLFHDAGGDRTQTIAALRTFIPQMKARGYRFTTVSEGLNVGLTEQAAAGAEESGTTTEPASTPVPLLAQNPPAAATDTWRGGALLWTVRLADATVYTLAVLFVVVGGLTVARTALLLVLATRHARQRRRPDWSWGPPVTEPVSVIVPAYNEKEGIEAAVRSLAGGDYPEIEVVVVDDGSTDDTAAIAESLGLPNVRVVRVPNGGKANALNTGVALARHDLIVMVDGDTIFEPDSIRFLVQPFASPAVGAVAGNVKVGNRGSLVALWQHIEYVIGFNLDRRLYEILRCMPTVPGAIGAFRRAALREVGGISDETLAEDTDVTMAMCRAGWRVVYEERARAWTEAPATLEQLYRQRYRWSYGTMQAMWKHRQALFDHGDSGRFGRRGLPFLALFGVALPMFAPVVDIMLVYGLVFWELAGTVTAWFAMLALQLVTAAVAFRFDRESMRPLWKLPLQQFAYRQLMYLVLMQSAVTALTGGRLRWHKLHRAGLAGARPVAVPADTVPPNALPGVASAGSLPNAGRVTAGSVGIAPVAGGIAPAAGAIAPMAGGSAAASGGVAPVVAGMPGEAGFPAQARTAVLGRAVPMQGVAPAVDTWPPVLGPTGFGSLGGHPAAGRAVARPPSSRPPMFVPGPPGRIVPTQGVSTQGVPTQGVPAQGVPPPTGAEPTGAEPTGAEPTGAEPTGAEPSCEVPSCEVPPEGAGPTRGEA